MKTIELKLYDIMELKDEAFRKAVDDNRDINIMPGWWECDGLLDLSQAEMDEIGVTMDDYTAHSMLITYKIDSFSLDRENYVQFSNIKINNDEVFRKFLQIPKELWDKFYYQFINDREENTRIEFCPDGFDYLNCTEEEQEIIERAEEIFSKKMVEARRQLHQMYEDLQTEDAVVDTLQTNGYTFLEDGTMYNA